MYAPTFITFEQKSANTEWPQGGIGDKIHAYAAAAKQIHIRIKNWLKESIDELGQVVEAHHIASAKDLENTNFYTPFVP